LFVLLSVLGGVALGLTLGRGDTRSEPQTYSVSFERDISGLVIGAPVTYLGVRVGDVRSIKLSASDHPVVEVLIEIDGLTPVNSATYARLALSLIHISEPTRPS